MILLLDSSGPSCRLTLLADDGRRYDHEWPAGRQLARGLLGFIKRSLEAHGAGWRELSGLGVRRGPGSYTGLRIGLTVMNTLADSLALPIVGATGDDWQSQATSRLRASDNDRIVLPEYGGPANITAPRK